MMKHSLIFLSLLTAGVLSAPIHRRSPYLDPDFGFDFGRYGHVHAGLFDGFTNYGGNSPYVPFGSGTASIGGGSLPPIAAAPATPPVAAVASAPVDAVPAPVAPVPAPVAPVPAPVAPVPAPVAPAPAPVDSAPVGGAAPLSSLPLNGVVASNPVPDDAAAPVNPPTFSEPPPLNVALASPGVIPDPSTFQAPGTPPSSNTPAPPGTPETPGTAADIGPIAAVTADPANPNSGPTQNAIDSFNKNIAPGLEQGHPVDHSGDDNIQLGLDMMNKQHGGRSGITIGNENVQVGIYRDFNPLKPLDTFDGSVRKRPDVLGIKATF